MSIKAELPLVCPFCDELSYNKKGFRRIMLPNKIYTLRQCPMGHEFYSVEEVPESQAEIVAEIKEIRRDAIEWKKQLRDFNT